MRLSELLSGLSEYKILGRAEAEVGGLSADSRLVEPGQVFVAIRGQQSDGHRYIQQALARGAAAIVLQDEGFLPPAVEASPAFVLVPDSRQALAWLSAAWHGYPARRMRVVGVTGTDGKTTTVNLIYHVLLAAGYRVGMISTVNAAIGQQVYDTGLHTTTPEAPDVQRYLAEMAAAGTDYALLESTSHGLAQGRVNACEFDLAVVTNITHEHLDYHGSYREYRRAKSLLFRELSRAYRKPDTPKVAVLNRDDSSFAYLRRIPADLRLSYGLSPRAGVWARDIRCGADGLSFTVVAPTGPFPLHSDLTGYYNVSNILAATAVALSQQVPPQAIAQGVADLRSIAGRMERIERGQPFQAIVDFAHTPFALQGALQSARQLAAGKVIAVFGCAGLRDRAKRQLMGHTAAELADFTVITAEDPRTEELGAIMEEVAAGCREVGGVEGRTYERIADRGQAIRRAVELAGPGDVIIVCGKGHEQSMCFGATEYPWDDRRALALALEGKTLRTLPTAGQ